MLERLSETVNLWNYLQTVKKPIVLYGMGDGALKIMKAFEHYQIEISAIFASDEFVRGHSFTGFPVLTFTQIQQTFSDFIIILAFAAYRDPLLSKLYHMSENYEFYAPDVPVCVEDDQLFTIEYIKKYEAEFDKVYELLADEQSKRVLIDILNFKVSGKVSYLKQITTPISEVYTKILNLSQVEHYIDLGAYNGDTIEEFLGYTDGKYASITAFEPDKKNYQKLLKRIALLNVEATVYHAGSDSQPGQRLFDNRSGRNSAFSKQEGVLTMVESVDHILQGAPATVIKLDVEGAEEQSLLGCQDTIVQFRPKLMISSYHKNSDLFLLPLLIYQMCPDYQFYLRHHPYIPAWETNYYLVPLK